MTPSVRFCSVGYDGKMSYGLDLYRALKTLCGNVWPSPPGLHKISSAKVSHWGPFQCPWLAKKCGNNS